MKTSILLLSIVTLAACSSHPSDKPATPDTEADGGPLTESTPTPSDPADAADVSVPTDASDASAPPTQASCLADCEAAHPTAAALSKKIDACFAGVCGSSCDGVAYTGKLFNPSTSTDAGPACTGGTMSDPIAVASAACADCVAANCCSQWIAVFSTQDGRDLNKCAVACYSIK